MTFIRCAELLDAAEFAAYDRRGGPTAAQSRAITLGEGALYRTKARTPADHAWLEARLARAEANDWTDAAKAPVLRALGRVAYSATLST